VADRVGTVEPGSKKTQGDLINVYKYTLGGTEEGGVKLFSVVPSDKARCKKHKPKYIKFCLSIRK